MPSSIDLSDLLRAKLPFWQTLKRAYVLTLGNLGALVQLSWRWLVLLLPFQLLYYWHAFEPMKTMYSEISSQIGQPAVAMTPLPLSVSIGALAISILGYVLISAPAVGWHRLILRNVPPSGDMQVDQSTLRYAGYVLVMYSAYQAPILVMQLFAPAQGELPTAFHFAGSLIAMVALYVGIAIFFRLSVVLPGIALDDPRATLANTWKATRGHTFRMFFGNLLAGVPFVIPGLVLSYLIFTRLDALTGVLLMPLTVAIMYIGVAVGLTFTSLAYRFLILEGNGGPAAI